MRVVNVYKKEQRPIPNLDHGSMMWITKSQVAAGGAKCGRVFRAVLVSTAI
jgi:hypothetical protein